MTGIIIKSNESNETNTNKNKKAQEYQTKRMLSDDIQSFFDSKMKPKKLTNNNFNYKYFMKLKGYLEPAKFMNILIDKLERKYEDCLIEPHKHKLRLNIFFEDEEEEYEIIIKLYQLEENEHIVIFDRKNTEIEIFYQFVAEIKNIIYYMN